MKDVFLVEIERINDERRNIEGKQKLYVGFSSLTKTQRDVKILGTLWQNINVSIIKLNADAVKLKKEIGKSKLEVGFEYNCLELFKHNEDK